MDITQIVVDGLVLAGVARLLLINRPRDTHEIIREVTEVPSDPSTYSIVARERPPTTDDHQIFRTDSDIHVGWRHDTHPDIEEALNTPGLSVRYPDGTVNHGVQ